MPNWCNTRISVKGKDAEKFDDFVSKVQANANNGSDFGREWLGELLINAGIEELDREKYGNCRGTVYRGGTEDGSAYTYDCDSAWSPCVDVFDTICQLKGFDVDIEYLATEPGCGVFLASSYEFAGGEYVINGYTDGNLEDFVDDGLEIVTKEELEKRLRNHFNDDTSDFKTLLDMAADIDTNSDNFLSINELEIASREELRCYHKEQPKKSKSRGM